MKNSITVIIPCYNVEKYLEKSVQSILNQTFKNLEIILVEDASKDRTKKIIEELTEKYDNVRAIYNKENKGAGYSRNRGIEQAKSEYISFIDADDYIDENYYEALLKEMTKRKADIVVCDISVEYEDHSMNDVRSPACENPSNRRSFVDHGLAASPCNKLFKKEYLEKYPFPEGIMNEDVACVIAILIKAKKVGYTNQTCYHYIQRNGSMQNATISEKRFDLFQALDILEERIGPYKKDDPFWEVIIYNQVIMFFFYVLPKEPSFKKRVELLKKFSKLSGKYQIRQNHLLWNFLECQGKKHKYYYKTILKLNCNGFSFLTSCCVSFYKTYAKKVKKSVIPDLCLEDLITAAKKQSKKKDTHISLSVVIPNYNYEQFMYQRIYSILSQKEKIGELILLDDCSTDGSRALLDNITDAISPYIPVQKIYNETNSGSPFKQWRKGFEVAKGNYVWIAEADDYCDQKFLTKVLKPMRKDNDVVLSYADTAFIDKEGMIIMRSIKPEIDLLKTGHWDHHFINEGQKEIKEYAYLNCTIANVSSIVFKNGDYREFFEESGKYRQAGDWLFYTNIMLTGKVAFYNKPLNYYRVHGSNVTSTTKKQAHLDEIRRIHQAINQKVRLTKVQRKQIEGRYEFLKKVWKVK